MPITHAIFDDVVRRCDVVSEWRRHAFRSTSLDASADVVDAGDVDSCWSLITASNPDCYLWHDRVSILEMHCSRSTKESRQHFAVLQCTSAFSAQQQPFVLWTLQLSYSRVHHQVVTSKLKRLVSRDGSTQQRGSCPQRAVSFASYYFIQNILCTQTHVECVSVLVDSVCACSCSRCVGCRGRCWQSHRKCWSPTNKVWPFIHTSAIQNLKVLPFSGFLTKKFF